MMIQRKQKRDSYYDLKSLAFRVTPEEHAAFLAVCKNEGLTISAVLAKLMHDYMKRKNK